MFTLPGQHAGMDHLPHGPFLVANDGSLTPVRQPALHFAWRGRGCEATLSPGLISLGIQAGAVPYTVDRVAERPGAFAELGALPGHLPSGWRMRVLPDHRVRLETVVELDGAATATALVGAMVGFAMATDPYLDRLESAGMGAAAGTAKT
jgi:hypothetical protein